MASTHSAIEPRNLPIGGADELRPKKRKRSNLLPRKRASTACQVCRLRKTKCDNAKPCSFCTLSGAICVYTEDATEQDSYDPASREILRKLDHVTTLLEDGRRGQVFTERNVDARGLEASPLSSITGRHNASGSLVDGVANAPDYPLRDQSRWSSSELPFSAVAYESFLRWPVFHNVMSEADQTIGSFLLESGHDHDPGNPSSRAIHGDTAHPNDASSDGPGSLDVARGVEEDDLIPLCTRFTRIVNVRNPVLDGAELLSYAKATAEHGLRYDGPSCLVLLASALACLASSVSPLKQGSDHLDSFADTRLPTGDKGIAQTYYLAAKKRFGILESTVTDVQCFYQAATYEKHVFRALQAWLHLQQACVRLRARLQRTKWNFHEDNANYRVRRAEQRLYWSCVNAESDLRTEIPLEPSGIASVIYPDLFPSPPAGALSDTSPESCHAGTDKQAATTDEESWIFYFAEISLRRLVNQALPLLYGGGIEEWIKNPSRRLQQCIDCFEQASLWYTHLPKGMQYENGLSTNDLAFVLRGRFLHTSEMIQRPMLYLALHHSPSQALPQILSLAQNHIDVCAKIILHFWGYPRHGNAWCGLRASFGASLVLLAVVLQNGHLRPPDNWSDLVKMSIDTLTKWANEAPDIKWMRSVLDNTLLEVLRCVGESGAHE